MSSLISIPLPSIVIDTDVNPRGPVDADRLQPLVDSISRHGVLQPVLVREAPEDGVYVLVAGQRRYTAAGLAGLTEIPAVVRDTNGDGAAVALVENLQREQLTPLEEAHAFQRATASGMTVAELALAISRSEQLVKDRLALLDLPDQVQKHVDTGGLTLGAAAALRTLAPAGAAVVAKAAELVVHGRGEKGYDDPIIASDLERDPGWVLEQALGELDKKQRPFLIDATDEVRLEGYGAIDWPKGVDVAALTAKAKKLPDHVSSPYSRPRSDALKLTSDDRDAARAYGCLVEVLSDGRVAAWINDPVWLADRLGEKLDKAIASFERKTKTAPAKKTTDGTATAAEVKEEAARTAAREQRAKERRAMLTARERNVTLGIALAKKLHAPKPTADNMRLIAELLFEYAADDLARRGLRFVDETSQTVSTKKDGSISNVAHLKTSDQCRDLILGRLEKAKTPEQVLGVMLQAIVAARLADTTAAPASDRYGSVRGLGGHYSGASKRITPLLDKVAAVVKPAPKPAAKPKPRARR